MKQILPMQFIAHDRSLTVGINGTSFVFKCFLVIFFSNYVEDFIQKQNTPNVKKYNIGSLEC